MQDHPSIEEILELICRVSGEKQSQLVKRRRGKLKNAFIQTFAIYACHYYSIATHLNIATYFGLTYTGSLSYTIAIVKKEIDEGQWLGMITKTERKLFIVQWF